MTITRLSGRQLNQDVSCAKPAAGEGPAIKTALEEPACARLFHDVYRRLDGRGPTIRELLDQPGVEQIELEPPRLTVVTRNVADFQPMGVDLLNPWER